MKRVKIISTVSLSNYLRTLRSFIKDAPNRSHDPMFLSDVRVLYKAVSGISPNDWYLTDDEEAVIELSRKFLKQAGSL